MGIVYVFVGFCEPYAGINDNILVKPHKTDDNKKFLIAEGLAEILRD